MVLLGIRNEGQSRMFLLQNWWKNKQFIEVSEDYIGAMDCSICFIGTPQTFANDHLPSYADKFVDNDMMDCPDARMDCPDYESDD